MPVVASKQLPELKKNQVIRKNNQTATATMPAIIKNLHGAM